MTSQVEVAEVAGYFTKWEDDKKAKYGSAYQGSHLSSMEFQAMNLKLPSSDCLCTAFPACIYSRLFI